jgi:histone H2B
MAKGAKRASKKAAAAGGKKRGRKPRRSFKTYISRVLKQTAKTKLTLSSRAAAVINSFVNDQFDRIATQAAQVARVNKKSTLGSREVQTAVRLALPAELAKHAMAEGTKAVGRVSA